jgi:PAS domain S-box-containing protein
MNKGMTRLRWYERTAHWWWGYAVAVVGTLIAALVRWALGQAMTDLPPYITFYPAVFVAAILGGTGPGLLAAFLSLLAVDLLFLPPIGGLGPSTTGQVVGILLFIGINAGISIFAGRFRTNVQALRENEARLQMAQHAAHIGAFEMNQITRVITWTPELEPMYGLKPGEFKGTQPDWEQLVHPGDRARAVALVERAFQTLQPQEGEWRVIWPDGSVHWLMGRFQAFRDRAGKPLRLVGINIDLTGRKRSEEAVRESAERFRALVTASSHVVYRMSPDWSEMRELRGQHFIADTQEPNHGWLEKYIAPEDQQRVMAAISEAIRTKSVFELEHRVRRVDSTLGWTFSRAIPLQDVNGEITEWLGTASDVTRRKQAQEALRQSEERFRSMADAIPQLAWIARADGFKFWYNRRWYEYTGTTLDQMEGWGWQSVHDPRTLPKVLEQWQHSIATGQPLEMESLLRGADGKFCTFLTRVMPLKNDEGKVSLWFGTNTDITAQKQVQESLREALAELEYMSYSMVHDMRAPLRAMQSFAELLQSEYANNPESRSTDFLRRICEAAKRLDRLITDALNYNKVVRENLPMTAVDLATLLRGMVETYPNLHPPAAQITLDLAELTVQGNVALLTQCFANLLDNAVKFVGNGVEPHVRIWTEPSTINDQPAFAVYIQDNGIGIEKRAQERIFRMFHRMHSEGEYPGTGIGLTIVRKAVERMSGRISIESELGEGTRFCVELPRPIEARDKDTSEILILQQ